MHRRTWHISKSNLKFSFRLTEYFPPVYVSKLQNECSLIYLLHFYGKFEEGIKVALIISELFTSENKSILYSSFKNN